MKRLLYIIIGVIFIISVGCNKSISYDEKTAENYVKSQGYEITSRIGEVDKYTLEKSKLYGGTASIPYQQAWSLQNVEPEKYFDKEIVVYGFTLNHPLRKRDKNAKNGVNVYVMLSDGKVIGGYSYPNADVVGAYSSIDGRTLEEVTGLSFQQWQENWKKKYGQDSVTQNVCSGQDMVLLDYFNSKYPNSVVTDKCLVDVDNDGLEELLVALNTYSGINKTQEEEARKNGFDMRHVGIIFPKGENPTESVGILGKTVEIGMRFEGSDLFVVEAKENKTDQVKVKMNNQNGKEDYFTVKVSFNKDGTRNVQ